MTDRRRADVGAAEGAPHSEAAREARGALKRLEAELAQLGSACVAFSGGADSSLVLVAAARALGPALVVAFTAVSATYLPEELQTARDLAAGLGVRHVVVETREFDDPAFTGNPRERCYFCKRELVGEMARVAAETGCAALVDGANLDDLGDQRPGMRASAERGVTHPLVAAGIDKDEVRRLSRELGLATWDAPQQACLASRIPYGEPITVQKLEAIAAAERVLHELGFRQCRVRHHGSVARVEVESGDLGRALEARVAIAGRLRALGFTYVTLDLEGFRSGSMNETPVDEAPGKGAASGGPASAGPPA